MTVFPCMGIPMLKTRRSQDRLIFNMGIPILVRRHLYIETALLSSMRNASIACIISMLRNHENTFHVSLMHFGMKAETYNYLLILDILNDWHSDLLLVWIQYMMTSSNGNIFRVTGHLCGEFTGPRWIPRTKASDAELWCFLWYAPE